jgi:hypothetical protein
MCTGARAQRSATGGIVVQAHSPEVGEKVQAKATLGDDGEHASLGVDELQIAQVRAVHPECRCEEVPQRVLEYRCH